jgi:hypothetical protein
MPKPKRKYVLKNPKPRVVTEKDVTNYFRKRIRECGGLLRKVKWEGLSNCPDQYVSIPPSVQRILGGLRTSAGWQGFVELKRPGEEPREGQLREMQRLQDHGTNCVWLSSYDEIDVWIGRML